MQIKDKICNKKLELYINMCGNKNL